MREIFTKLKMPLIVIAVIFAGFIVYNTFVKQPDSKTLLKTTTQSSNSAPESNFLPILLEIQNVKLDENIFLDPVFRALIDFSQPIVPESLGKNNPFSGAQGSSASSSVEGLGFTESDRATALPTSPTVKKK
jgi:hypothetical protein